MTTAMTSTTVTMPVGPDQRGTTRIEGRVVERIAARAARESGLVTGPGQVRDLATRGDDPRVSATVDGQVAVIRIVLGVVYPEPVGRVTRLAREHVRARVLDLTGISVRQIDIEVVRLPTARAESRRVR